jgi:hypothetical protein
MRNHNSCTNWVAVARRPEHEFTEEILSLGMVSGAQNIVSLKVIGFYNHGPL